MLLTFGFVTAALAAFRLFFFASSIDSDIDAHLAATVTAFVISADALEKLRNATKYRNMVHISMATTEKAISSPLPRRIFFRNLFIRAS